MSNSKFLILNIFLSLLIVCLYQFRSKSMLYIERTNEEIFQLNYEYLQKTTRDKIFLQGKLSNSNLDSMEFYFEEYDKYNFDHSVLYSESEINILCEKIKTKDPIMEGASVIDLFNKKFNILKKIIDRNECIFKNTTSPNIAIRSLQLQNDSIVLNLKPFFSLSFEPKTIIRINNKFQDTTNLPYKVKQINNVDSVEITLRDKCNSHMKYLKYF